MAKNDELEALRAELAAAKAEVEALKAAKPKTIKVAIHPDKLVDPNTTLGRLQRLDRALQIDAFPKLARQFAPERACELVMQLATELAGATNRNVDEVVTEVTTKTPKTPKAKNVQDNTGEQAAA